MDFGPSVDAPEAPHGPTPNRSATASFFVDPHGDNRRLRAEIQGSTVIGILERFDDLTALHTMVLPILSASFRR